jgi:hypothetical protein
MSSEHSIFTVTYRDAEGTSHPLFTSTRQQMQRVAIDPTPVGRTIAAFISSDPGEGEVVLTLIGRERLFSDIERLAGDVTRSLTQHGQTKALSNLDAFRIALVPALERASKGGSIWYSHPIGETLRRASDVERQGNRGHIITPR